MAEVKATITELQTAGLGDAYKVVWPLLAGTDTGEAVALYGYNDRSVQVEGTFDSGTVTMKGSNDSTNFEGIRDPSSTALTFAAAGLKGVLEAVVQMKPVVSGGGGSCALTVTMICARTRK